MTKKEIIWRHILYESFSNARENFEQRGVINAVKKFLHVSFPNIRGRIFFQKSLRSLNGTEQAFANSARPRIIHKCFVVNGREIIIKKAMDNPVTYQSNRNFSPFVIADDKFFIAAVAIRSIIQIFKQSANISLQIILEPMQLIGRLFALPKSKPAAPYIF